MARQLSIHPVNPQTRAIDDAVDTLRSGGLLAYPTDSGYALGAPLGDKGALERIRRIRQLDDKHHFTLVCRDFAQLGQFVHVDNTVFRAVKAVTPGPYTFILPATREVPRRLLHPKKKTVGARIPDHQVVRALLDALGEPIASSTLILPDEEEAMTEAWRVASELEREVDLVIDSGDVRANPTTVIDLSGEAAEVVRVGAGDPDRFLSS